MGIDEFILDSALLGIVINILHGLIFCGFLVLLFLNRRGMVDGLSNFLACLITITKSNLEKPPFKLRFLRQRILWQLVRSRIG